MTPMQEIKELCKSLKQPYYVGRPSTADSPIDLAYKAGEYMQYVKSKTERIEALLEKMEKD